MAQNKSTVWLNNNLSYIVHKIVATSMEKGTVQRT